jgi:hypothetical protein
LYDINCNLCEIDTCYEVSIGDTTAHESCCCVQWSNEPVRIMRKPTPETKIRPLFVNCGGNINLSPGEYTVTAPAFICSPTTCNATFKWEIGCDTWSHTISGNSNSLTFNFALAGHYVVTFTPQCGSCKCAPCTIFITIEGVGTDCKCGSWSTGTGIVALNWRNREGQKTEMIKCGNQTPNSLSNVCLGQQFTCSLNSTFNCIPPRCLAEYSWVVKDPDNVVINENYNPSFKPTKTGIYTMVITPKCGNTTCPPCVVKFQIMNFVKCL